MDRTDRTTLSVNVRNPHAPPVTAEDGSVSGAAERMRVSPTTISHPIANLEQAVGVPSLEREVDVIAPTGHAPTLLATHKPGHHADHENQVKPNELCPPTGRRKVIQMAATITLTYPFSAQDTALLNKLLGNPGDATSAASGTTPSGGAAAAAKSTADEFFPADPGIARFPSPEDSQILVFSGKISGRPYLKDQAGAIHQIRQDAAGIPQYFKNGRQFPVYPGESVAQCLVRQGEVYMQITSGIWKHVEPNGSMYNKSLPPAWTTPSGASATPNVPALAPLPTPSAIAPGSSGRVIAVGPSRALKTLSAAIPTAAAGDKIQLDPGTYTDTPPAWSVPLLIDFGGATFNAAGKTAGLAGGKALLCPRADSIIQNGTIASVAMDQPQGELTSAIRPDAGCGYLTINRMTMVDNQCAVGHGGFPIVIAISDSNISGNGLKANSGALTHNLYVGNECRRLTLTNVISNGSNEGHAIKYRGPELIVNGGTFAAARGKPFDIPNGSTVPFQIIGATLIKGSNDPDHGILAYGVEASDNGLVGGTIKGGSIHADCDNPMILGSGGTITISEVAMSGNKISASGGVVLVKV